MMVYAEMRAMMTTTRAAKSNERLCCKFPDLVIRQRTV
jgi:hypothetical protein